MCGVDAVVVLQLWTLASAALTVVGSSQSQQSHPLEEIGRPFYVLMCISLLVAWNQRSGWLSVVYSVCVVAGLLLCCIGDIILVGHRNSDVALLGFVLYLFASLAFGLAFVTPTVPTSYLNDASVDLSWWAGEPRAVASCAPHGARCC